MIKQTDLQARLRLLRYGLLVVVIVTFIVSISYPVVTLGRQNMGDFILQSLLYTAVVAVICVGIYFAYDWVLHRTMGQGTGEGGKKEEGK